MQAAIAADETLSTVPPAEVATALATLADVEARLRDHDRPALSQAIQLDVLELSALRAIAFD